MRHAEQTAVVERLIAMVENGDTSRTDAIRYLEAEAYLSKAIWQQEIEEFFDRSPLVAALSADLSAPGSFTTQEIMGTPILLVRGRDGAARAFLNMCRHRGARIVDAEVGSASRFACPVHAWTYDSEGKLTGVSRSSSFGAIQKEELGLVQLPLCEKYGLIWISRKPGPAIDIDEHLEGLGEELATWDLPSLTPFEKKAFENRTNWKVALDTFGETYHLEALHKESLGPLVHSNVHCYDAYGRNHRIIFAAKQIEALKQQPKQDWLLRQVAVITYYLFPNTELVLAPDGTVSLVRLFPDVDHSNRTRTTHSCYLDASPTTPEAREAAHAAASATTALLTDEDYAIAETVQLGLETGAQPFVLFGRNEPGNQHFHASFKSGLGLPPLGVWPPPGAGERPLGQDRVHA